MTTEEKILTPVDVEAITAGGAAIRAWLDEHDPDVSKVVFTADTEEMAQVALDAAGKVYDAADEAFVQDQLNKTQLLGLDISNGAVDLRVMPALETAAAIVMTAKTILDGNPGAQNYVEHSVIDRETGDRYVLTVHKPAGKTPHELRQQAESEAARLHTEVTELRALIADLADPEPCWFDHHGYCQEHGWNKTDPRCPHARAKAAAGTGEEQ